MERRGGGSLSDLRRQNLERVIGELAKSGHLHRAELARRTGVSRTTITTITRELTDRGLVVESTSADRADLDGRAGELLGLNDEQLCTAGIENTLDTITVHVRTLSGKEIGSQEDTVPAEADWRIRRDVSVQLLHDLLLDKGVRSDALLAVGIGVPGQVDQRTGIVTGALPDQPWSGINVRDEIQSALKVPVLADNNVRFETFAESQWGAGQGIANLLYVHVSSGIGAGMILNGELHRGSAGGAGELGHVSIDVNGAICRCGNRGCLVLSAGRPAIVKKLQNLWDELPSWEDLLQLARDGDRAVVAAFEEAGTAVGQALAGMCNLLNPERIVIGGDSASVGRPLLRPIETAIRQYTLKTNANTQILTSELGGGPQAGAAGGAALVWQEQLQRREIMNRLLR